MIQCSKDDTIIIVNNHCFAKENHYNRIVSLLKGIQLQDESTFDHATVYYTIDLVLDMLPTKELFIKSI